ncbi:MAG TPA: winged helix-turn-helix domain-containing protein [Acidimicrobiales bacterium]
MRFRFAGCELDTGAYRLEVAGRPEPVEPQVFDLLVYLIEHRDRVVPKEELLDSIWGDRFVSESALSSRLKSARRAVGDDGRTQRVIRTVHGRGYQFVAPVEQDGAGPPAAARAVAAGVGALPAPSTPLVGRRHELSVLANLAERTRLLTLTGPGGVGKTRLAVELATRIADRYPDGARFVTLTSVGDPQLVPQQIAGALGARSDGAGPEPVLHELLRGRTMLVVVDNFEHVVEAAPLLSDMLGWSPGLSIHVTSRERLRLAGEQVYEVPPLAAGREGDARLAHRSEAALLFEQSARAVDPSFAIDESNDADVVAICRAVDGLPLAVELAAAQVRVLPPSVLRDRLASRIDALSGGMRDRPTRHQTMRATIAWSYDLLGPGERRLLHRLGVFAAPASLDAIEAVCAVDGEDGDPVVDLAGLVDKSLVRRIEGPRGEPRFTMLELVRDFAVEQLDASGEGDEVRRRHAHHVLDLVTGFEEARWRDATHWLDDINELAADTRAAHRWAVATGERATAAGIVAGLFGYTEVNPVQLVRWIEQAVDWIDDVDPLTAGRLRLGAGYVELLRGHLERARAAWQQALELFSGLGHDRYSALAMAYTAATYIGSAADYEGALGMCAEAAGIARRVGEEPLMAHILNIEGELARVQGDDDRAGVAYRAALDATRVGREPGVESTVLANLSYLAAHRGDYDEAHRLGRESLRMCWALGLRSPAAWGVGELAGAELGRGRPEQAARLVGASDAALEVLGTTRGPGDQPEHERVLRELERALGAERLTALVAEGAAMTLEECVREVLAGDGPDGA